MCHPCILVPEYVIVVGVVVKKNIKDIKDPGQKMTPPDFSVTVYIVDLALRSSPGLPSCFLLVSLFPQEMNTSSTETVED